MQIYMWVCDDCLYISATDPDIPILYADKDKFYAEAIVVNWALDPKMELKLQIQPIRNILEKMFGPDIQVIWRG